MYEPNPRWLKELLESLNRQRVQADVSLLVCDDCSPRYPFADLEALVRGTVTQIPFRCMRNENNMGSNATFERLTREAQGEYIAYCDQDDIWEEDKLQKLLRALVDEGAALAYADMCVIDEHGQQTARSFADRKKHVVYRKGNGLAAVLLSENFVSGCSLLMRLDVAKAAVPFPKTLVHDQWLAMNAAVCGPIAFVDEPLVRYRIHGENQTPTLGDIHSKRDYIERRILPYQRRMREIKGRIDAGAAQRQAEAWADCRVALAAREKQAWRKLYALRHVNPKISWFELLLPWMPDAVFNRLIRAMQRGVL